MRSTMLLVAALSAACGAKEGGSAKGAQGPGAKGRGPMKFPVEVEAVEARKVEYAVQAVGSIEAFERLQVTSRVPGVVERVSFAEGDPVKQGQVLVEIEPDRFRIAVRSASATLARAETMIADAERGLDRRIQAVAGSPGLIPAEEVETFRTKVRASRAEAQQAQAALEQAQLNLRDAYVRAPAAGVIETRNVQTGQYVQPGTLLATLVRREPLLVRFDVPEPDAARLTRGARGRFRVRGVEKEYGFKITHVAQAAETASRMVPVTGEIDDPAREALRPGAFAQVTLPIEARADAPVIAETAVRPSERGFLAYVVEGGVARERVVELGLRTEDGKVEVKKGVQPGEQLVIRGGEALRDGAEVRVAEAPDGATR